MSPDGPTKPLPEEKLLKLIRGQQAASPRPPSAAGPVVIPPVAGSAGTTVGVPAVSGSSGAVSRREQTFQWVRFAVVLLGVVLTVEVLWLAVSAMRPLPAVLMPQARPVREGEDPETAVEIPSVAASLSESLFAAPAAAPGGAGPRTPQSATAKQLAGRLSLMGIVSGEPLQAIIEDSETKKTYFVTTGQVVVDEAVLERVLENHVVLDVAGEKIELSL